MTVSACTLAELSSTVGRPPRAVPPVPIPVGGAGSPPPVFLASRDVQGGPSGSLAVVCDGVPPPVRTAPTARPGR
ncbi:hypothetical protein, partial [Streptomyces sp. NRRL B-24085]|uniref:hypothetical protein n=1 Tax=Streptomyces sp. NRRL B-24085 TaxID=1709476 RepID=UPI001C4F597C